LVFILAFSKQYAVINPYIPVPIIKISFNILFWLFKKIGNLHILLNKLFSDDEKSPSIASDTKVLILLYFKFNFFNYN